MPSTRRINGARKWGKSLGWVRNQPKNSQNNDAGLLESLLLNNVVACRSSMEWVEIPTSTITHTAKIRFLIPFTRSSRNPPAHSIIDKSMFSELNMPKGGFGVWQSNVNEITVDRKLYAHFF